MKPPVHVYRRSFLVKIGLKFQSLCKISNISTSDPPVLLSQFHHCPLLQPLNTHRGLAPTKQIAQWYLKVCSHQQHVESNMSNSSFDKSEDTFHVAVFVLSTTFNFRRQVEHGRQVDSFAFDLLLRPKRFRRCRCGSAFRPPSGEPV